MDSHKINNVPRMSLAERETTAAVDVRSQYGGVLIHANCSVN